MRKIYHSKDSKMHVHVVTGTYVTLLGIEINKSDTKGLMGFAIQRKQEGETEWKWLQAMKVFEATTTKKGALFDTNICPVQGFLWQDFTVKPGINYQYRVIGMTGTPTALQQNKSQVVNIKIATEAEGDDNQTHNIWFNRGFAGSQAYSVKFGDRSPEDDKADDILRWLSRGLFEALTHFLKRAKNKKYALRGALYEFQYDKALAEFAKAAKRTDLQLVIDMRDNKTGPKTDNLKAIAQAGIPSGCIIPRTANPSYISHNKFLVLLENGKPIAVWTGSTNITKSGIFGQSNLAHVINDPAIAQTYLDYFNALAKDPNEKTIKAEVMALTPNLPIAQKQTTQCKFSPRADIELLDNYKKLALKAKQSVFFTSAFGIGNEMVQAFAERKTPSYLLMENLGTPANAGNAKTLLTYHSNLIAVGSGLSKPINGYEHWIKERTQAFAGGHVHYVHDKFMIIDPLTADPIIVSGSANFSKNSTVNNDENMLVIRGETRVADIYLTEFIRIWRHYYFRHLTQHMAGENPTEGFLTNDSSWLNKYYDRNSKAYFERTTFRIK